MTTSLLYCHPYPSWRGGHIYQGFGETKVSNVCQKAGNASGWKEGGLKPSVKKESGLINQFIVDYLGNHMTQKPDSIIPYGHIKLKGEGKC